LDLDLNIETPTDEEDRKLAELAGVLTIAETMTNFLCRERCTLVMVSDKGTIKQLTVKQPTDILWYWCHTW
jgi:hypothetical protein